MGFESTSKHRVNPSEYATFYKESWNIFGSEVLRLQELAWKASLRGKKSDSLKWTKGANIYFYLMYLLLAVNEKQELLYTKGEPCPGKVLDEMYSLSCVAKSLECASAFYNTDYTDAWEKLLRVFTINRDTTCDSSSTTEECPCIGIGQMVIEDPEECLANIVGLGKACGAPDPIAGEFAPCEFVINEFSESSEEAYETCNNANN